MALREGAEGMKMGGGALRRRTNSEMNSPAGVQRCWIREGLAGARPSIDVAEMSKV
jgi:hypothetical protein